MGKRKHFKYIGFLNILGKAEIHTIPKTGKSISIVGEKYDKRQTFRIYGFLKYLGLSRNVLKSQNMRKPIPIVEEKYGKTKTFQS